MIFPPERYCSYHTYLSKACLTELAPSEEKASSLNQNANISVRSLLT